MTADLSGVTEVLRTWADRPAVAVALLESQLGSLPQEAVQGSLTGWNRLLVGQSALLSAGQNAVEDYLQGQQEQPGPQQGQQTFFHRHSAFPRDFQRFTGR